MPQYGKVHGAAPPDTATPTAPASTSEDQVLFRLNKSYREAKAQQILRLLKDQDALNQIFRNCDLLDDEDNSAKDKDWLQQGDEDDEDAWSLQEEQRSEAGDSDLSENEADRRAARYVALRRHHSSVDPGRCKTSMGFYNQAEVTEIPYDTDSDNVNDSACSTPCGTAPAVGATPAADQPSAKQAVHGQAILTKGSHSSSNNSSRVRKHLHPNAVDGGGEVTVRELSVPEERLVHSARSSRPKTSLTSSSSTWSRYYRQQPHPEAQYHLHSLAHPHHSQFHPLPQPRGIGDTRQAIISRLYPHHPMAVRPFCESTAAQEEAARAAAAGAGGAQPLSQQLSSSQTSTTSKPSVGRHHQSGSTFAGHHPAAAVTLLYDMSSSAFSKDGLAVHSTTNTSRARAAAAMASAGESGSPSHAMSTNPVSRSTSFLAEHQRMVPVTAGSRARLSVDSSPIQLGDVSPHHAQGRLLSEDLAGVGGGGGGGGRGGGGGGGGGSPAARLTRVKKRAVVGEMAARGSQSMHALTAERAHHPPHNHPPSMTVMKLPPLDTGAAVVGKGPGASAGRDLVCVGKD